MSIPVWIDTDTGVDDAVALMIAAALQKKGDIQIVGVSAVYGNTKIENTYENARNVLSFVGCADVPVYRGTDRPMIKEAFSAEYVHGANGLNNVILPPSEAPRQSKCAWDALYEAAVALKGELELVLLGPDTNAAFAFIKHPDLKNYLKRILIMGGAEVGGNVTAAAEFNIWEDPHAAEVVFKSGVPVVMCGLDVTMKSGVKQDEVAAIKSIPDSKGCELFRKLVESDSGKYQNLYETGFVIHDICPVLYTVYPEIFMGEEAGVFVETRGKLTIGKTVSDRDTDIKFGVKNTTVVLDLDREKYVQTITQLLASL